MRRWAIVFLDFLRVTEYSPKISRARNFIPTSARLSAQKCSAWIHGHGHSEHFAPSSRSLHISGRIIEVKAWIENILSSFAKIDTSVRSHVTPTYTYPFSHLFSTPQWMPWRPRRPLDCSAFFFGKWYEAISGTQRPERHLQIHVPLFDAYFTSSRCFLYLYFIPSTSDPSFRTHIHPTHLVYSYWRALIFFDILNMNIEHQIGIESH